MKLFTVLCFYLSFIRWIHMEHSLSSYGRALWGKISQAWSLDLRSLSLFRIGLAIVILCDLWLRSRYLMEHYTDVWIYPRSALQALWEAINTVSIHTANGTLWFQEAIFSVHAILALALLVWFRSRIAIIGIWILTVSLQNRNTLINSGADDLLRMVIFWSMFLPLDRYWSWDKDRYDTERKSTSILQIFWVATVAYITQQCLMYWITAYLKFWPEWYITHSAVYEILALESFHLPLSDIVFQFPTVMRFLSASSMIVEFVWPLLLISPFFSTFFRYLGIFLIIGLHAGIVTHISVGIFPWISSISMLALLPSHFWEKIIPRLAPSGSLTVYFDDHCWLCSRWIRIIKNYWTLFGVQFTWLSQAKESIQKISAENDMWVISRGRHNFLGYTGFVELMKQSWLGRPYGFIWNIWPLKIAGNLLYKIISKQRKFCSLPRPIEQYMPSKISTIFTTIIVSISLYCVIIVNFSVMSCHGSWMTFFKAWPLSFASIMQERKLHLFESNGEDKHLWWSGENFTQPKSASSCSKTIGEQYSFVTKHTTVKKIFVTHMNIIWWWTMIPRLDQYWWMFAPDPLNIDQWFVIDGVIKLSTGREIHRDLWKEYVYGTAKDGDISFTKYANPHELTISDRWRKYITLLGYRNNPDYTRYFAEYWCKRYNSEPENPIKLDRFTIFKQTEIIKQNYERSPLITESMWQHCCLKNGCFETKK